MLTSLSPARSQWEGYAWVGEVWVGGSLPTQATHHLVTEPRASVEPNWRTH